MAALAALLSALFLPGRSGEARANVHDDLELLGDGAQPLGNRRAGLFRVRARRHHEEERQHGLAHGAFAMAGVGPETPTSGAGSGAWPPATAPSVRSCGSWA